MPEEKMVEPHHRSEQPTPLVLYDGVCGFCDRFVSFLLKHDRQRQFYFAALQSETGAAALRRCGLPENYTDSVVLIDEEGVWLETPAALRIARRIGFPWSLAYGAVIVPPSLRSHLYRAFAARRYRWFGRLDACRLPSPEDRSRFLS